MGFKKLPFEWREQALKMRPSHFMVWLAHYWRSDKEDAVEIANSQLVTECDLGLSTVKEAKRWLKDNGWLTVDKAAYKNDKGEWQVPRLTATYPGLEYNSQSESAPGLDFDPGLETNLRSRVGKPPAVNPTPSVDTQLHPHPTVVNTNGGRLVDTAVPGGSTIPFETKTKEDWERMGIDFEIYGYLWDIYLTLNPDPPNNAHAEDHVALTALQTADPDSFGYNSVLFAHHLIWAATKSNYWGTKERKESHPALLAHYISKIDKIAAQYQNYYARVKKKPHEMARNLESILAWRQKAMKAKSVGN